MRTKLKNAAARAAVVGRVAAIAGLLIAPSVYANFLCDGTVSYLGVNAGGEVTVSVGTQPIHYICNMSSQGSYAMTVASCKAAYSALLTAKMAGKRMVIYYGLDPLTCSTLPAWSAAPTYFVQGPE